MKPRWPRFAMRDINYNPNEPHNNCPSASLIRLGNKMKQICAQSSLCPLPTRHPYLSFNPASCTSNDSRRMCWRQVASLVVQSLNRFVIYTSNLICKLRRQPRLRPFLSRPFPSLSVAVLCLCTLKHDTCKLVSSVQASTYVFAASVYVCMGVCDTKPWP